MTEKRINLCFDVDDPMQLAAYQFIKAAGRKKTALVIQAVSQISSLENSICRPDVQTDSHLVQKIEEILKSSLMNSRLLENIGPQLNLIQLKLNSVDTVSFQPSKDSHDHDNTAKQNYQEDKAFDVMMEVFGAG